MQVMRVLAAIALFHSCAANVCTLIQVHETYECQEGWEYAPDDMMTKCFDYICSRVMQSTAWGGKNGDTTIDTLQGNGACMSYPTKHNIQGSFSVCVKKGSLPTPAPVVKLPVDDTCGGDNLQLTSTGFCADGYVPASQEIMQTCKNYVCYNMLDAPMRGSIAGKESLYAIKHTTADSCTVGVVNSLSMFLLCEKLPSGGGSDAGNTPSDSETTAAGLIAGLVVGGICIAAIVVGVYFIVVRPRHTSTATTVISSQTPIATYTQVS